MIWSGWQGLSKSTSAVCSTTYRRLRSKCQHVKHMWICSALGCAWKSHFFPGENFSLSFPSFQPPTSLLLCSSMRELGSREREREEGREGAQRHNCHSRDDDVIIGRPVASSSSVLANTEREMRHPSLPLLLRLIDGIISSSSFFVSMFVHSQMICITHIDDYHTGQ